MTLYLKDELTSKAVRKLASLRGVTLTEAVFTAVNEALAREPAESNRGKKLAAIQRIQAEIAKHPRTGLKADKAFFDEMWDDL